MLRLLTVSLFILFFINLRAQYHVGGLDDIYHRQELSFTLGMNNFMGDLGGNKGIGRAFVKDFNFKTVKPLIGFSYAYYPENWYKIRGGFNLTILSGADSLLKNTGGEERWRVYRNLSFQSNVIEAYAGAEIYPLTLIDRSHTIRRIDGFINFGIGAFHFNPKAKLNGEWIDLQPLHLEGQDFAEYPGRKNFKLTQLYIPVSAGMKYFIDDHWSISGGFIFRKTFTDYIDAVSTTYIDPKLFDKYLSPSNAILAKQLYARSLRPEKVKPDVDKADRTDNDSWVTMFVTLSFAFGRWIPFYYGGM